MRPLKANDRKETGSRRYYDPVFWVQNFSNNLNSASRM